MENKGDFGHASNGGTGFRLMYDGGDNKFKLRSADDDNVNDRLTCERDSGDMVISGSLTAPSVVLAKSTGDAGNTLPAIWDSNGAGASLDYTGVRAGKIPYSVRYNVTSVTNSFGVTIDVGTDILTEDSLVVWSVQHQNGHLAPYTWARTFHMNYGLGTMLFQIGAGATADLSANTAVSGTICYAIM